MWLFGVLNNKAILFHKMFNIEKEIFENPFENKINNYETFGIKIKLTNNKIIFNYDIQKSIIVFFTIFTYSTELYNRGSEHLIMNKKMSD
jgi:hypothetical protein